MKRLAVLAAIIATTVLATVSVKATDLVVAPLNQFPGAHEVWAHNEMGQSFVATASSAKVGFLLSYDAAAAVTGSTSTAMTISLYDGEGLVNLLAQTTTTVDSNLNGYLDFDLAAAGITLIPGNTYTIGLSAVDQGWINPSVCVFSANAQPTGAYDLGHPFFNSQIVLDETGICDNSFHVLDLVVVPTTPIPSVAPTVAPTTAPTGTPIATPVVISTGKKIEKLGRITEVGQDYIKVDGTVVYITATTKINLNHTSGLVLGMKVNYKGVKNTDGSVTASNIEVKVTSNSTLQF